MIKVVTLFKRREGISHQEFRDYYEDHHCKLFEEHLKKPGVKRYVRRYLKPSFDAISGEVHSSGFDALMELWVEKEWFDAYYGGDLDPEFRALIAADEEKLFDRAHIYKHIVEEECDTVLPLPDTPAS